MHREIDMRQEKKGLEGKLEKRETARHAREAEEERQREKQRVLFQSISPVFMQELIQFRQPDFLHRREEEEKRRT